MAIDTTQPFTRRAALASGITVKRLAGPTYRRLFHGVYVDAAVTATTALRAKAALLVSAAGSYASHHTAAVLWGGWAPPVTQTHITTPTERSRSERRGIVAHEALHGAVPVMCADVPTAPATEVFLGLAAEQIDVVDLVIVGDSLVRAGATTPDELVRAARESHGHGCRLARRAARWVRTGVDSVMETRLRMMIVLAGLPEPTINHIVRDHDGSWVFRIDLSYLGLLIAIEYDGRQHAENTGQWNSDIRRREQLESEGWRFIVVTAEGIYRDPLDTIDRIRAALRARGETAGRRRPSPEWQRSFPGRQAA